MFWKTKKEPKLFAVVSAEEANMIPYPYVYVEKDGEVRELHSDERKHMETLYHPSDGARPYVKNSYEKKNAIGAMTGYCLRSKISRNINIAPPPDKSPTDMTLDEILDTQIKMAGENGFETIKDGDKLILKRKK